MKIYTYKCPINVQASDIDEAKNYLEGRLKNLLKHPEGIDIDDIVEVKECHS